jgi:hypothetical protein
MIRPDHLLVLALLAAACGQRSTPAEGTMVDAASGAGGADAMAGRDGGHHPHDAGPVDAAGPQLNSFWNHATKLSPDVWYVSRAFVRPSTGTATPIHALAVYFPDGPPASVSANLVVSADHPCGGGYCTVPLWVNQLVTTPVFAVNGDYFTGVDYGTGAGNADTRHLWMAGAAGVIDPGTGAGGVLSSTGHHVRPSVTSAQGLPSGTVNAVGGNQIGAATAGIPTAPDYFAARTGSGIDDGGMLYVLVGEGFDHAGSVSGPGLTVHDLWKAMTDMGATTIVEHDGGGSSQLFIKGQGLVYPSSSPRFVANLFGVQD